MIKLYLDTTAKESEAIETLMKEREFKSRADFLRECINTYAGKEILKRRHICPRNYIAPKCTLDVDCWKFAGGEVVIDSVSNLIKVYFDEKPDIETRLNARMLHFVPKEEGCVWVRVYEKHAIPKVRAFLKPI